MHKDAQSHGRTWRRSRYGLAAFWFVSLLTAWLVLRLVLFVDFKPGDVPLLESGRALASGLWRDCLVACWLTLPLLAWVLAIPEGWFRARWHRAFFWSASMVFWLVQFFLLFVEYFFFEEFKSRFNT